MTTDHPAGHVAHLVSRRSGRRPQTKLVAVNGHDHRDAPKLQLFPIAPAKVQAYADSNGIPPPKPLPEPYVDIDLVRLERIARRGAERQREQQRNAERAALDAALQAQAGARRTPTLGAAARAFWFGYFALMAAVCGVAVYAWIIR